MTCLDLESIERQGWKQGDENGGSSWSRGKAVMAGILVLAWRWREVHGLKSYFEGGVDMTW